MMFIVFLFMFIFLSMRNSILLYYFKYYLDPESMRSFLVNLDKGLFGLLNGLKMTNAGADFASNTFSVINIISQLAAILGIALSNFLARRLGKRETIQDMAGHCSHRCTAVLFPTTYSRYGCIYPFHTF